MTHFMDLLLLQDPEFPPDLLRGALMQKLHRALFDLAADDIAISFPQYDAKARTLGATLRLHGSAARLQQLQGIGWFKGMRDHLDIGPIEPLPSQVGHRRMLRLRANSNMERIKRRQLKRHPGKADQIEARFAQAKDERLRVPFVRMRSKSTGEMFPLFLALGPLQEEATPGRFNHYGLSDQATVPWF